MTPAFWDTSALVPLCVQQHPGPAVQQLLQQYEIVVWWATSVEMRSAFERLPRMGQCLGTRHSRTAARKAATRLARTAASDALRAQAEAFLKAYTLKAADSLQLAAAWNYSDGKPQNLILISADAQLPEAARQAGFQVVAV